MMTLTITNQYNMSNYKTMSNVSNDELDGWTDQMRCLNQDQWLSQPVDIRRVTHVVMGLGGLGLGPRYGPWGAMGHGPWGPWVWDIIAINCRWWLARGKR